jgi:Arc/MetJ family transcription regulator
MTKKLIDIDDDLLSKATSALGSTTMKQTVADALELAVRIKAGRDHLDTLRDGTISDLSDEQVMVGAWR